MQKVAIITGTSSGLGLSLSLLLAQNNYKVYALMRDITRQNELVEQAGNLGVLDNIVILEVDMAQHLMVEKVIAHISTQNSQVDILINNAGIGFLRNVEQATIAEIHDVMQINYYGVVYSTRAILPKMREQKHGKIINISSIGGLVGQPFNEIYCASKFAVERFTESLATYMDKGFNIKFCLVELGGMQSNFATNVLKNIQTTGGILNDQYKGLLNQYIVKAQQRQIYQSSPSENAQIIFNRVINNPNPPLRIRNSPWAEEFTQLKTQTDPDGFKIIEHIQKYML